ncbi:cysteine desulfurase [Patescibacteria group bacterium]|nr:cysteine desulfurase [Patescibacteria group bacterium]
MKTIYFDNAATTPVDKKVIKEMSPFFNIRYGNSSEYHSLGLDSKAAIEASRRKIANFLGCKPSEIIFTSSATESINLSHKGLIENILEEFKGLKLKPHIITTQIEHKAVLETCRHLEKLDWAEVTYLPVDTHGLIKLSTLKKMIRENTVLVSIMYVNNEVGTIEPVSDIGKLIKKENLKRKHKILFHTDATQAVQYLDCKVNKLGVDFLSLTGHKIYAPKGIGALFVRKGISLIRQIDGGAQENGLRSSTENVPYIVALGAAIEQIKKQKSRANVKKNRDFLIKQVLQIPGVILTGHPKSRAPHIASFIIKGIEGESVVLRLSEEGIYASSGSACTSASLEPSHVLTAMGFIPEESHGSIRLSLGKNSTKSEVLFLMSKLPKIIEDLRKMSPLN